MIKNPETKGSQEPNPVVQLVAKISISHLVFRLKKTYQMNENGLQIRCGGTGTCKSRRSWPTLAL